MKFAQEQYISGEKNPDSLPWISQKTKITKLTEETIFLERFWDKEGNKIKFEGIYEEMPDELVNEPIGTIFIDETGKYKTGEQKYRRTGKTVMGHSPESRHHIRQGISKWYYENGKINKKIEYKDGIPHGIHEYYWPNGKLAVKKTQGGLREKFDEEGNQIKE